MWMDMVERSFARPRRRVPLPDREDFDSVTWLLRYVSEGSSSHPAQHALRWSRLAAWVRIQAYH